DEISPVQRKIRVELPADMVANGFSRAYQDLARRVRIKGFRTGKAPRSVLQGIYGDELRGQVRSQLLEDSLGEVIRERGLQIVSRPEIEANDLVEGGPFSFSAVFEIKPSIDVKNYFGLELERVKVSVSEDQVNQAMSRLQESYARLEPVENQMVVQRGDFVTLDFEGFIDGKAFPAGKGENYVLEVGGGRALPQFEEAVAGLPLGERRNIQVVYPENYPNSEISGKLVEFSVVVREIKQKVLPALDDDFAKDHGECSSLDELRGTVRARLEDELKHIQHEELKEQIVNRLLDADSFMPPPAMVERQTRYLMERYQNQGAKQADPSLEETRKTMEARATRQVQATLVIEKIAQLEKIEVSDKEVQERVDSLARAAGDRGKNLREVYSKPDTRDDLRAQMVFDRTVSFLLERAHVKEVDPPATKVDEQGKKG
ncbi:MAG: trigger factor, partial [Candidatus Binatia bacterium]